MMQEHNITVYMNNGELSESVLSARAASYLAYADTTNTLAYLGAIVNTNVYRHPTDTIAHVQLTYEVPVLSPSDEERFSIEMEQLSRVFQHRTTKPVRLY